MDLIVTLITCLGVLHLARPQILQCDFDSSTNLDQTLRCLCSGVQCTLEQQTSPVDEFNWWVWGGSTPSSDTGPSGDHTQSDGSGKYIYGEASDNQPNSRAEIRSPTLNLVQTSCLTFWYHMSGQHIGSLEVLSRPTGGSFAVSWERTSDQGDNWIQGRVVLTTAVDMVAFRIIRGGSEVGMPFGDTALDDIKIESGICPGFTTAIPTPTSTPAPTPAPTTTSTTAAATSRRPDTTSLQSTQSPSSTKTTATSMSTDTPTTTTPQISTSNSTQTTNVQESTATSGSTSTTKSAPSTVQSDDLTTESEVRTTKLTPEPSASSARTTTVQISTPSSTDRSPQSTSLRTQTTTDRTPTITDRSPTKSDCTLTITDHTTVQDKPGDSNASSNNLWGLDETLWIIILVVAGAVILVLLVIVCVQACAMRRMRTARIVRQSDDYSNIEAFNREQNLPSKQDAGYINAYDNMAMEHDDKPAHTNGGGML